MYIPLIVFYMLEYNSGIQISTFNIILIVFPMIYQTLYCTYSGRDEALDVSHV